MDPQAPTPVPEKPNSPEPSRPKDNHWVTILAMALFVLLSLAAVAFLYYQNQKLKSMLALYQQPVPIATPGQIPASTGSTSPIATTKPVVTSPKPGDKVTSQLTVTGTVPSGWMFEGVFPIKLVDSNKTLIVQGQAKEKVAGSWQSGNPVEFTATLTFTTTAKSGFLVLENDNPSGDPSKSQSFEVPVTF